MRLCSHCFEIINLKHAWVPAITRVSARPPFSPISKEKSQRTPMTVAGNASGNAALLANATTVIAFSPMTIRLFQRRLGPGFNTQGVAFLEDPKPFCQSGGKPSIPMLPVLSRTAPPSVCAGSLCELDPCTPAGGVTDEQNENWSPLQPPGRESQHCTLLLGRGPGPLDLLLDLESKLYPSWLETLGKCFDFPVP